MSRKGRGSQRSRWNLWQVAIYAGGGLLVLGGLFFVVRSATNSEPPLSGNDFRIVAYQGDDVLGGHESTISHLTSQGQPVVLNFFAGQCPPCRAEMPGFQRVADQYQSKVIFVGVDIGPYLGLGSHDDARALLAELRMRYPAAYAADARPLKIYGVRSMPTTIIFDSSGRVVETHTGIYTEAELSARLRALVAR